MCATDCEDSSRRYPQLSWIVRGHGYASTAALPLALDGRVMGLIAFHFRDPRPFPVEERMQMSAFAAQCAQALERARLFGAERSARAEAEAANRAKSEFLATMSHELRTPLNAIGGYVQIMEMGIHGQLTAEQRDDLARINRSQRHLLGIINDILNYARIEAGHVEYCIAATPVVDALANIDAMIAPLVAARGHTYDVRSPDRDLVVLADPEKLEQILLNLLSNAVKFTAPAGHITVAAYRGRSEASTVDICITDTGSGIPQDKLDAIFDPFVQVDGSHSRERQGTGLGLAISRDLARGMGGDLRVRSEVGRGSSFTLTLPAAMRPEGDETVSIGVARAAQDRSRS